MVFVIQNNADLADEVSINQPTTNNDEQQHYLDDDLAGIEPMSDLEDSICMLLGNADIQNLSPPSFDLPNLEGDLGLDHLQVDLASCGLPRDALYGADCGFDSLDEFGF